MCLSENEVRSGALLALCYCEATEIDCAIDQLKSGLKSMVQYFLFLKSALVICLYRWIHNEQGRATAYKHIKY